MTNMDDYMKRGFKELQDEESYPIHEWKAGDILAGLLIGKREVKTDNGISILYSVEVDQELVDNFDGEEKVSFWGTHILDTRLKNVEPGMEEIVIEYLGKKKSSKGGREYHDFRVLHKEISQDIEYDIPDNIPPIEEDQ